MNSPTDYPPPGITQAEWHGMSTSERAALVYDGEPGNWEHLAEMQDLHR
ncbi:hypothetical protein [Streptomyces sp900116325]